MTGWLLVAPAVLAIILLFIVPIGYVLLLSVTDPTVSFEHYRRIFTVPLYGGVMLNTFKTSLIVTIACHVGLRTIGGTAGVGKSTTVSVVAGSVAVIACDFFVTQIFFSWFY